MFANIIPNISIMNYTNNVFVNSYITHKKLLAPCDDHLRSNCGYPRRFVFNPTFSSNSLNSLANRLEKEIWSRRTFWYEIWFRALKLMQKMVIYRYKSPFNFIFEPEFSKGSPVGEPGGT